MGRLVEAALVVALFVAFVIALWRGFISDGWEE